MRNVRVSGGPVRPELQFLPYGMVLAAHVWLDLSWLS